MIEYVLVGLFVWVEGLHCWPLAARPAVPATVGDIPWYSPLLDFKLIPSRDSESFKSLKKFEIAIPLAPHPGSFAFVRKHHIHEGVDLYCPEGTPVTAVEDGTVVAVLPFTGAKASSSYWSDTDAVLVEGRTGVVVYGEISTTLTVGQMIKAKNLIGCVKTVLIHDKGRPMAMLHLELHKHGTRDAPEWPRRGERPNTLLDPTWFLLNAANTIAAE
jgi:murein DD-endopeptidase MepM/ murein hydrolase activator NlpD